LRSFGSWLAAIARHRATRLGRRRDEQSIPLDDVLVAHLPSIDLPFDGLDDQIECAMKQLPHETAMVARLYYLQNWTTKEVSSFLSLPVTTVKWRLHSARILLRKHLEHLENNEYE
jgi:RNA polymerase sigma-70 factor (ECF subfamily)